MIAVNHFYFQIIIATPSGIGSKIKAPFLKRNVLGKNQRDSRKVCKNKIFIKCDKTLTPYLTITNPEEIIKSRAV